MCAFLFQLLHLYFNVFLFFFGSGKVVKNDDLPTFKKIVIPYYYIPKDKHLDLPINRIHRLTLIGKCFHYLGNFSSFLIFSIRFISTSTFVKMYE